MTFEWVHKKNGRSAPIYVLEGETAQSLVIPASLGRTNDGYEYEILTALIEYFKESTDGSGPKLLGSAYAQCAVRDAPAGITNITPPSATGDYRVGTTLSASPGEWSSTDGWSFSYTWSGSGIATTTGSTLPLQGNYAGVAIKLTVAATKLGYNGISASATLAPIKYASAPIATTRPSVVGGRQVASVLTVNPGVWNTPGLTYGCSWFRGTTKLGTTCSYTPTVADFGQDVFVKVTGAKSGYVTSSGYSSAPVRIIAGPGATVSSAPVIAGTSMVGELLTLDRGQWSLPPGAAYSYQWLRNGVAIPYKTSMAYAVVPADSGQLISAVVTVTARGYTTSRATTPATSPVAKGAPPTVTTAPKVSGVAQVGSTLSATAGSWSKTGLTFTYTWLRNGTPISGATSSTYKLTAADWSKTVAVRISATSSAWNSATTTSAGSVVKKGAAATATARPKILGTTKTGNRLTASTGTWSASGLTFSYQWYADNTAISGATTSSLPLKLAQKGKAITVKVTATRSGYNDGSSTSVPTAKVQ